MVSTPAQALLRVAQAPLWPIQHPFPQGSNLPRVPAISTYRRQDDDESYQSDCFPDEDLARTEVHQQWLAHVQDILVDVPHLEPTPDESARETHVHSLAPKSKKLKMPLLPAVKEMLNDGTEKSGKNFNHTVKKYYPVHDKLEKGVMQVRDVSQCLITEVHPSQLHAIGASSVAAPLEKGLVFHAQEEAALSEAQFATSSLRLVNSNILSMSLLCQLLSNVHDQVECLSEADSVPSRFDNVKADLDFINKAIVDMDGGNGDLLKVVAVLCCSSSPCGCMD